MEEYAYVSRRANYVTVANGCWSVGVAAAFLVFGVATIESSFAAENSRKAVLKAEDGKSVHFVGIALHDSRTIIDNKRQMIYLHGKSTRGTAIERVNYSLSDRGAVTGGEPILSTPHAGSAGEMLAGNQGGPAKDPLQSDGNLKSILNYAVPRSSPTIRLADGGQAENRIVAASKVDTEPATILTGQPRIYTMILTGLALMGFVVSRRQT
jgi:hypothetical protein